MSTQRSLDQEARYTTKPEVKRGARIVSLGLIGALGVGALAGCATAEPSPETTQNQGIDNEDTPIKTEKPSPSPSDLPNPSPTSVEVPTTSTGYEFNVPKETVDRLTALAQSGELNQLDIQERGLFALNIAQESDIKGESALYADISGNKNNILADTPSIDNTPQEIVAFGAALDRLIYTTKDPKNPVLLDRALSENIAISSSVNSLTSLNYAESLAGLDETFALYNGNSSATRSMAVSEFASAAEAISAGDIYNAPGSNLPSIDIVEKDKSGEVTTKTYQWITFTNGTSAWLPQ